MHVPISAILLGLIDSAFSNNELISHLSWRENICCDLSVTTKSTHSSSDLFCLFIDHFNLAIQYGVLKTFLPFTPTLFNKIKGPWLAKRVVSFFKKFLMIYYLVEVIFKAVTEINCAAYYTCTSLIKATKYSIARFRVSYLLQKHLTVLNWAVKSKKINYYSKTYNKLIL